MLLNYNPFLKMQSPLGLKYISYKDLLLEVTPTTLFPENVRSKS